MCRFGLVLTYTTLPNKQPLSLLLKLCPLVDELALYDVVNTPGVAADLSHISSNAVCCNPNMLEFFGCWSVHC